jgi:hypothetical protein
MKKALTLSRDAIIVHNIEGIHMERIRLLAPTAVWIDMSDQWTSRSRVVQFFSKLAQSEFLAALRADYPDHGQSVVYIVDEAQRFWPKQEKVDEANVEWLAYHRHDGVEMYLVTQAWVLLHPTVGELASWEVRALTVRIPGRFTYGYYVQTVAFRRESHKYDKKIFALYQSFQVMSKTREVHPLSRYAIIIGASVCLLIVSVFWGYRTMAGMADVEVGKKAPLPATSTSAAKASDIVIAKLPPPPRPADLACVPSDTTSVDSWLALWAPKIGATGEIGLRYLWRGLSVEIQRRGLDLGDIAVKAAPRSSKIMGGVTDGEIVATHAAVGCWTDEVVLAVARPVRAALSVYGAVHNTALVDGVVSWIAIQEGYLVNVMCDGTLFSHVVSEPGLVVCVEFSPTK